MTQNSREIFTSLSTTLTPDRIHSIDTQHPEKNMREAISAAILTELSYELSNEELGAAVRLIARLCETNRPISLRTAHISAGMDKDSWGELSKAVLQFFDVSDRGIDLPGDGSTQDGTEESKVVSIKERQNEMNLFVRTSRRPQVPQYAAAEKPPNVSIRKAIWDQAITLFKGAGMSEKSARSVLASMLKNYPEGDVAMAVSDACAKDALAEPHTWIFGRLKAEARKRGGGNGQGARGPSRNKLVTPELTGISNTKAEKIRQRNASLKLKID
jgi:hypothetical protein